MANTEMKNFKKDPFVNIHVGFDFECDQTKGFPTFLYYDEEKQIAWLELSEGSVDSYLYNGEADVVEKCQELCIKWGIHPCSSWEDYYALIKKLDAKYYEGKIEVNADINTEIPVYDEEEGLGGMSL